jgi:hypothetical protein
LTAVIKNAGIGMKRMGVILWCVLAIVVIVFLALHYSTAGKEVPMPIIITAMTLVAALGGVDVWKQRKGVVDAGA